VVFDRDRALQQGPSVVTRDRSARVLVKIIWAALVVAAMVVMTKGLWATVYVEPTSDALAEERRGHLLVAVASVLLVALAAFAHRFLATPLVTPLAILAAVAACVAVTLTSAAAVISLLVAYPLVLGALAGALAVPRRPAPWIAERPHEGNAGRSTDDAD
jgi:hypothetical protein